MRIRSRLAAAITLPLLAAALAGAACGGGASQKDDAERPDRSRSIPQGADASQRRPRNGPRAAWPHRKTLARIAGETVVVGDRRVRVDPATVTCGGDGAGSRRGRELVWESFTCIQPTFGGHGVAGPDVVFQVQPTGRRSFRVTGQRFTRY
jgi:hypothetical protein